MEKIKKKITFVRHASGSHQEDQHKQDEKTCHDDTTVKKRESILRPYQDEFYEDGMLNTKGHEQATKLGLYFRSINKSYKNVFCSPARRVIETCDHVVKNKKVFVNDELIELNCTNYCNRKHNKAYLERFTFPRDNCYNLTNVNDDYSPDNILMVEKVMSKMNSKDEIIPIIENLEKELWEIFKDVPERKKKFTEKEEDGKIKIKEAISFLRISNFIEDILRRDDLETNEIIVFTHGDWIAYLKKLYLNTKSKIGNCTFHDLELKQLDENLIILIKQANDLINKTYANIKQILMNYPDDIKKLDASQYPDIYVIDENYKSNKYKSKFIEMKNMYECLNKECKKQINV
jgi:broad specificity phosphatase PhoE